MAVGLNYPQQLLPVAGIQIAAAKAGLYPDKERNDIALIQLAEGGTAAAVFTRNRFCAAPVTVARQHLSITAPRLLLVNAGNANAGTGARGIDDAEELCKKMAIFADCDANQVVPFSTGVIGEPLPVDIISSVLDSLYQQLSPESWLTIAEAIMTTDTIPKACSSSFELNGEIITLTGIAKGAGMIRPDMATMLSFIATDINIDDVLLQTTLEEAVEKTFNRITIDGDTSTNDACVLLSSRQANNILIASENDTGYVEFQRHVFELMAELAQSIIRDGEGATKFVSINIKNGKTADDCLAIAYSVAESPLVKTALTASDPNWGRILAAVGKAKVSELDIAKVSIFLDEICIVENGGRADGYTEELAKEKMLQDEISINIDLGLGKFAETIWTTDLSYEYIKINAEYRT